MNRILERQEKRQAKEVAEQQTCPDCNAAILNTSITACPRCMNCGWRGCSE